MKSYDHRKIEGKWQKQWASKGLYKTKDAVKGRKNFFLLTEFPYPSGNLHVGHWYAFAVPDILARFERMRGKNVLYPIGFDAFGLPAENAAIKNKLNPRKWTFGNIARMQKQIASMGTSFDWSRQVITCDPEYYKWTQWQFLQFYKNGLAYRKQTPANWCPSCKTVLANEQVTDGACERCGSEVVQKEMMQWNMRITSYADRLHDDLAGLDWPEEIKQSQRNWIGRSEGAEIPFQIGFDGSSDRYDYILLHGRGGSPSGAFWPWLKHELERRGHSVQIPVLPNTDRPDDDEQAEHVLRHCSFSDRTVLVGHSFGGLVALRLLEKGVQAVQVSLIGTPYSAESRDGKKRTFVARSLKRGFDTQAIRRNGSGFVLMYDSNDDRVAVDDGYALAELTGGRIFIGKGERPHFLGEREHDVLKACDSTITVFTTRADTIHGATYLVIAPEHPWVSLAVEHQNILANREEVIAYIALASKKTDLERQIDTKTGVLLEGVYAVNPATDERMPIYVADYVLAHYGTGAIMAVPAHDERDAAFARAFGLPTRRVIVPGSHATHSVTAVSDDRIVSITASHTATYETDELFTGEGVLINSGEFDGIGSAEARALLTQRLGIARKTYRLRDWIVSRQRYWGVPIPIIHCAACGEVPVPEKELPVKLPEVKDYLPEGTGKSPLAKATKWVAVKCPMCKGKAERETDTFDTFVDSSWYFQRYTDPNNKKMFADKKRMGAWLPVDLYSGGAEHTTMHLLYSRFWHKAMYDLKLVKDAEPYARRMNRSLIMGPDGQKMSKSKGNVIDPDEVVARLGSDTVRMYLAFIGPYGEVSSYPWNPDGVVGVRRFIERVWKLQERVVSKAHGDVERALHQCIKKLTEDVPQMKFNTAIAQLMMFLNVAEKHGLTKKQYQTLMVLLAPFAPHVADELWSLLGGRKSVHLERWPKYDPKKLVASSVTIGVQVNGKTRTEVEIPIGATEADAIQAATGAARQWIGASVIARAIYVPQRLVNLVLAK